eukprot:3177000-Rhodomonas_salina.1
MAKQESAIAGKNECQRSARTSCAQTSSVCSPGPVCARCARAMNTHQGCLIGLHGHGRASARIL